MIPLLAQVSTLPVCYGSRPEILPLLSLEFALLLLSTPVKALVLPLLYLCCTSFLPLLSWLIPPVPPLFDTCWPLFIRGGVSYWPLFRPLLEYLLVSVGKVPALLGYPYYLKNCLTCQGIETEQGRNRTRFLLGWNRGEKRFFDFFLTFFATPVKPVENFLITDWPLLRSVFKGWLAGWNSG